MAAARPSLDDRYAVGYCIRCTAEPRRVGDKMVPAVRSTIPLIRADLFSSDRADELARQRRERTVVRRALGQAKARATDADLAEWRRINGRWEAEAADRQRSDPS